MNTYAAWLPGCSLVALIVTLAAPASGGPSPGVGDNAKERQAVLGREVYQLYCAPCHGANGDGKGPIAAGLKPPPTDFTDRAHMGEVSDDRLATLIRNGGKVGHECPTMPSWAPILRPEEVSSVVARIRSFGARQ